MISKALRNVVSLTIALLIVAAAIAQTPIAPAGRFHHSSVYDETRKQFLIDGGFTWSKEPRGSVMCGDGTVPSGS
jgi:hypothetical protein